MNKIRIINFRTFLFSAAAAISAVLSFVLYYSHPTWSAVCFIVMFVGIACLMVIYRKNPTGFTGMLVVLAVFSMTVFSCIITAADYDKNVMFDGDSAKNYHLQGTVEEVYDDGLNKSILVSPGNSSGVGNVMVYFGETAFGQIDCGEFRAGDIFISEVDLKKQPLIDAGDVNGYFYRLGVKYVCYVGKDDYSLLPGKSVAYDDLIRENIRIAFTETLGKNYGEIAYGMIVGDKSQIEFNSRNAYGISGIGHILAVSGLHVMFLSWLISWICKRLKAGKIMSFSILLVFLVLYNCLVGFTASVFRATIMSVCMLLAGLIGERNDSLNNLGLACSVFLVIKPFGLFDAGFLMSVGAVAGIIFFSGPFEKFLSQIFGNKLKKISEGMALSLSAQIGITPAMIFYFSKISVYSVVVNIMMSYVIMATFMVLFAVMIITLIIPVFAPVIIAAYPGLWILDKVTDFVSGIPYVEITLFAGGAVFCIYAVYFCMSRFVMKGKLKWPVISLCIVLCISTLCAYNISFEDKTAKIYCFNDFYGQSVSVVADKRGKIAVVASLTGKENLFERLKNLKVQSADEMILLKINYSVAREIIILAQKINLKKIYLPYYEKEACGIMDKYRLNYEVLPENKTSLMGFSFLFDQSSYHAVFECYESMIFLASGMDDGMENLPMEKFSLIRTSTGDFCEKKTVLANHAYYGKNQSEYIDFYDGTYYFDLKTGKTEILN